MMPEELLPTLRRSAATNALSPGTPVVLVAIDERSHSARYLRGYRALAVRHRGLGQRSVPMVVVVPEDDWRAWHDGLDEREGPSWPNARVWPADLVWFAE